jgi:chromosomal replication initiator protein
VDNLKFINLETTESSVNLDANSVWKNCLTRIKENVTLMTYNTWFLPIRPVSYNDNNLKVQLPNQFFWEWIDEHFSTIVKRTIQDVLGENGKLSYIISDEQEQKEEFVKQNSISDTNKVHTVETKRPEHETNLTALQI